MTFVVHSLLAKASGDNELLPRAPRHRSCALTPGCCFPMLSPFTRSLPTTASRGLLAMPAHNHLKLLTLLVLQSSHFRGKKEEANTLFFLLCAESEVGRKSVNLDNIELKLEPRHSCCFYSLTLLTPAFTSLRRG